jgi:cytochrome P450
VRILPGVYLYLVAHPEAIEQVLFKNHKNYCKPDVVMRPASLLMGNGIFTSEGDFWLRQRRIMQPVFLRHQLVKLGSFMGQAVDGLIERWSKPCAPDRFDIVPEMMRLALRIASTSLMGTDISADADDIGYAYRIAFEYVSYKMNGRLMLPLGIPTRRNRAFQRSIALLDRVVIQLIESRRKAPAPGNDLLGLLLAAQDEESGAGMTDQQLKDEVITLLTAGHETIGAALSWSWYLLGQHGDVQEALGDEAAGRLQGRTPTIDDLPHLPLATAVLEESMRLYPPAWGVPREALGADDLQGHPVAKGAILTLAQFLAHRHPDFWTQPDRFDPTRFLPGQAQTRHKGAYFPFGGGPRICIGNHLAMMEGTLVLAALAQRFRFTLVPGQTVTPDATFTLRPRSGVQVSIVKRS